jgi:hypothetical protein
MTTTYIFRLLFCIPIVITTIWLAVHYQNINYLLLLFGCYASMEIFPVPVVPGTVTEEEKEDE